MRLFFTFLFIVTFTLSGWALELNITATRMEFTPDRSAATFMGDVHATYGTLSLRANKVDVAYGDERKSTAIRTVNAVGDVRLTIGNDTATGNQATYTVAAQTVDLVGNVKLIRDGVELSGERLVYNIASGTTQITSSSEGRVKASFGTPQE
jgi:lipopolysaccharide export system protein LptA